ncbi:BTAD domain-containing putative transcriptional regulator [Streptomyces sp. NPDC056638]|uniref:AfsR/SARP family transcriptional regulator n=1 Tax=Streptomyces sp. NPDC056638 TaxID=3345887 RepID=UPI0036BB4EF9
MQFRILGPLEVVDDGRHIDVSGQRQRTVLAMLLLESGRVVSNDRLVEAIWERKPPATSRTQVQIGICALRRMLPAEPHPGPIVTRSPGYLLRMAEGQLDLHAFEERVAAGRRAAAAHQPQQAVKELRAALGLWQGHALTDISSKPVRASAVQLDERRLAVQEQCLELELRLGHHHRAVSELGALVTAHPLRERLRVLLMTALHRAGRQAEALDAYRQARAALVERLGIEPGAELQRLHRMILAGEEEWGAPPRVQPFIKVTAPAAAPGGPGSGPAVPALPAVPATAAVPAHKIPRLLPADIADFTGRTRAIQRILAAPTRTDAPRTVVPVTVITGRGGSGKTTLAVHVAHRLAPDYPDGQLFAKLSGAPGHPTSAAEVLRRFLRALGVSDEAVPSSVEERAEMYRDLLAERRVLVVLDGAASECQVAPLLPGSSGSQVLITSWRRFTGLPADTRIELSRFQRESSVEMLMKIIGRRRVAAEPLAVEELCRACDDLPLVLRAAAARLAARPHRAVADAVAQAEAVDGCADAARRPDELRHVEQTVRTCMTPAYAALGPEAQRALRRLAQLEIPDFAPWVGAPLLACEPHRAQDLLDELTESYLLDAVVDHASRAVRYRFPAFVRAFALERLAAEESPEEQRAALWRVLDTLAYLTGEAQRRSGHGDPPIPDEPIRCHAMPRSLIDRLLADPFAWYQQERAQVEAAGRQAAEIGLWTISCRLASSSTVLARK